MIVADTSAMLALLNRDDQHHEAILRWYDEDDQDWILPWAILPEIDYLLATRAGRPAQQAFLDDLASNSYLVDWGGAEDLPRVLQLSQRYKSLGLGLVDAAVMATAERLRADAIATLDLRHFGSVKLTVDILLVPRDG